MQKPTDPKQAKATEKEKKKEERSKEITVGKFNPKKQEKQNVKNEEKKQEFDKQQAEKKKVDDKKAAEQSQKDKELQDKKDKDADEQKKQDQEEEKEKKEQAAKKEKVKAKIEAKKVEARNKPVMPKPYDLAKAKAVIEAASDSYVGSKVLDASFDEGDEPEPNTFKNKVKAIKEKVEELEDGRKLHVYVLHKSIGGLEKKKFQKLILKKWKVWQQTLKGKKDANGKSQPAKIGIMLNPYQARAYDEMMRLIQRMLTWTLNDASHADELRDLGTENAENLAVDDAKKDDPKMPAIPGM